MPSYWTTGKLANFAGLSIRTLRYYDQIGLFSPSMYTESGHRRYTDNDLQKLLQILVFKQMGLQLDEIQEILSTENHSIVSTLDQQIHRVKSDIDAQQKLLKQLEITRHEVLSNKDMSFDKLTILFDLIKKNRSNYFTNEQLEELKRNYQSKSRDELKRTEETFKELLTLLRNKMDEGVKPTDPSVKDLASNWRDLAYSFSHENKEIEKRAENFYADYPEHALHHGLDDRLYDYIQKALT